MRDEMFHRTHEAGREALHDGIDRLIEKIMTAFRALERVQFNAPWRSRKLAR
ncbi:hypothetical protein G7076_07565 [Sphingomonas sp. HDW15A]|uniref:hypothetical protein n=1 Tax=Sphingomonas sp. HDW15A TaxID=2714942 RepID=UPI00140ACFA9|nr:hypothetical protein [Sphingomonas sp. HDW15A]QIK96323.1 hypothetical protein G7076_07565 [Sphingomonas sp. HDW15A]